MPSLNREGVVPLHRTLLLVQTQPYPLTGGVSLRNWQNINLLAKWGPVSIFSFYKGNANLGMLPLAADWQHYDLSTSSRPLLEKVQRRLWRLRPTGYARVDWLYTRDAAHQLCARIATFRPTLIVIEEIWLYRYLPVLKQAGCPLILDNHNVEGDDSRYQGISHISPQMLTKIRRIEENFIRAMAQVWMCSQEDVELLHRLYPTLKTTAHVIPNGLNPDYYKIVRETVHSQALSIPIPRKTNTVIYLGRFSYQPNAEAASILLNHIYPSLKNVVGNCRLLLVGCDPTEEMLAATQGDPQIIVTGQVEDVRPYLGTTAAVMAVPLQKGSGTRLKLLEAFAAKCPVVSTAKGAEGLDVEDGKHLLLRESSAAMVSAIQQLWQQPQLAQVLTDRAYKQFLEHYAWSAVDRKMQMALAQLLG